MTDLAPDDPKARDALIAAADLVGRSGGKSFQIGYLHDDVPSEEAAWYAHAQYRGVRITAENHRSPEAAAEALAVQLLTGAKCVHCGRLVALSTAGAVAHDGTLIDGTPWTVEQARAAGQCLWKRDGARWDRVCGDEPRPPLSMNRAQRRARQNGRRRG